jgi:hypothetical protein
MKPPSTMPILKTTSPCLAKLDRLGWTAGLCLETYGLTLGVRVNREDVLPRVLARLPPAWRPCRSAEVDRLFSLRLGDTEGRAGIRRYTLLYAGILRRARTFDVEEALQTLEAEMRQAVAAGARPWVFVHAGVVGFQGRAILVPGRSGAGKSTLISELVRAGATYYSDEFAVLDRQGRVHPFLKPLSLRRGGGIVESTSWTSLGGRAGEKPLRPILVALASHREGAIWRPVRLSPGRGLLALMAHTVPVRRRPAASLVALRAALAPAVVVKGNRGEAAVAAKALLRAAERALRDEERSSLGEASLSTRGAA